MNTIFADAVYVVSATKNGQSEFWAAATPRRVAAAQVQRSLPPGWKATLTSWRLSRGRAAELEMRPNTVRKLTELHPHSCSSAPEHWAELDLDKGCGVSLPYCAIVIAIISADGAFIFTFSTATLDRVKVGKSRFRLGSVQALSQVTARIRFGALPCSQDSNSPINGSRDCDVSTH